MSNTFKITKQDGTTIVPSMNNVDIGATVIIYEPGDTNGTEFTIHEKKILTPEQIAAKIAEVNKNKK